MAKVLLVDNEMTLVQMVGELLRSEGHAVLPFTNGPAALQAMPSVHPELVLADLALDRNGTSSPGILQKARSLAPPAVVIMISPPGAGAAAVESMKKGAYDYLEKPFAPDELKLRVQRALSYHAALSENVLLRKQMESTLPFKEIVGASSALQNVLQLVSRVADLDCPLLLCGEKGTGKKLIARTIHANSRRRLAPFLTVNCSALPEHLLETELFGCKKGVFAGAVDETQGVFQEAPGGTVLLESIEVLSLPLQERVLEMLLAREATRPSENTSPVLSEARVVAAANEPLLGRVNVGSFRQELYKQFSSILIELPSLRERREDIPLLITHFLDGKRHRREDKPLELAREALDACLSYPWPGNIRELQQAIDRACVVAPESLIRLTDLPGAVQRLASGAEPANANGNEGRGHNAHNGHRPQGDGAVLQPSLNGARLRPPEPGFCDTPVATDQLIPLKRFLRDQELNYLHRILAQVGGSKERAAELLGISLATIYRKLSEPEEA